MKIEMLERFIAPLRRKIMQTVSRGIVKALADGNGIQKLQVALLADELQSNVDRIQNYGFTSVPKAGAEVVFLSVGGSREHGVIIAVDDRRYRLQGLAEGEVALYTDEGDKIHFKRGGIIEINATAKVNIIAGAEVNITAGEKATITAPDAEVTCDTATVTASAKAEVTAPEITLIAATKIDATTPLLNVSGVISCSGIATGGAPATPGNATIGGNISATGNVEDANGTMQEMRSTYNTHTHPENGTGGGTTSAPNEPMS